MFKIKKDFGTLIVKFSIRLPILRKILRLVNKLVDDCYFYFKHNGIVFDSMDGSHIGLIYAIIDKTLCNTYEYKYYDPLKFFALPMDVHLLRQMVDKIPYRPTTKKKVGINEILEIEGYENGLRIILNNKKGSIYIQDNQELDTEKEINGEKETLINVKMDYEFTVNSSDFRKSLNIAELCSEVCTIVANGESVNMVVDGLHGSLEQEICVKPKCLNPEVNSEIQTGFSIQYLKFILNKEVDNTQMKFLFGFEKMMIIEFPIEDKSFVRWFLAPRVEEE